MLHYRLKSAHLRSTSTNKLNFVRNVTETCEKSGNTSCNACHQAMQFKINFIIFRE